MKKRLLSILLAAAMLVAMLPMAAQAAPSKGTVVGGRLRLRQSPSLQAAIITSYPTGSLLTITGSTGDWYQVVGPDGLNGYVMAAYVNASSTSSYNAFVISQNGKGVRLRSGPGTTYRVYAVYPVGTPVTVLQHGAYWDFVRIGYRTGYMMNEFLTTGSTPAAGGYYAFVTSTNGYGVRLRARPSQSANIMGVYSVGTRVYVITHDTYWDYIRVGTREGYMMNKFLIRSSDSGVTGVLISPATATVAKGSAYDFSATVAGTAVSQDVQWTISGSALSAGTSISSTGRLYVAADEASPTITVKASSIANSHYNATATVTVSGSMPVVTGVSISAAANASSVGVGTTLQFAAAVTGTGTPSQEVTWTVSGAMDASTAISAAGLLTVAPGETATSLNVIATSKANTTVSGSKNVSVTAPPTVTAVTVDSTSPDVAKGSSVQLTAMVTGTNAPPQTVTWSLDGTYAAGTKVDTAGILTVDTAEAASAIKVVATSTLDTTKSGTKDIAVKTETATVTGVNVAANGGATSVAQGATLEFNAVVLGTGSPSQAVTWTLNGTYTVGTTVDALGKLTVSAAETAATITVVATSKLDNTKYGSATVAVTALPTVTDVTLSADGGATSVVQGGQLQFSATVNGTGSPSQDVTWTLEGSYAASTTVDATGLLRVDASETASEIKVVATSQQDGTKNGSATVAVTALPTVTGVTVSADGGATSVVQGGQLQFSATVNGTGSPSQDVTWTLEGSYAASTTVDALGKLTVSAAEAAGTITVVATSMLDNTKYGSATVAVTALPTVTDVTVSADGGATSVVQGGQLQFSATVNGTGSPSQDVTWTLEGSYAASTTVDATGLLNVDASETASEIKVVATSQQDGTKSGSATVAVIMTP